MLKKKLILICVLLGGIAAFFGCKGHDGDISQTTENVNYSCTVSEFSDFSPSSLIASEKDASLILNGIIKNSSSTFFIDSEEKSNDDLFSLDFNGETICDVIQDKKTGYYFIISYDEENNYSIVCYDINNDTSDTIYSTNENILYDVSISGNELIIPLFTMKTDIISIDNVLKYNIASLKSEMINVSDIDEFSGSDLMPLSFHGGNFDGFIVEFYNMKNQEYSIVKYSSDLNCEYVLDKNNNVLLNDENYKGMCFSGDGNNFLLHRLVEDNVVETDIYEIKNGNYKDTVRIEQNYNNKFFDGTESWMYFFTDDELLNAVTYSGEVVELFSDYRCVDEVYEKKGVIYYTGHESRSNSDISYVLNSENIIADTLYVSGTESQCYLFSFIDNGNIFRLYRDENERYYIKCVSDNSDECYTIFDISDYYIYEILNGSNTVCGIFSDDENNYRAVIFNLNDKKEFIYSIGNFKGDLDFYLKDSNLYILNETDDKCIIYEYCFASGQINELSAMDNISLKFAVTNGDYDFCCFSGDGVYGYQNNELEYLFNWNEYKTIPHVYDICVNGESSFTIAGEDTEGLFKLYNFEKSEESDEKRIIEMVSNMDLSNLLVSDSRLLSTIEKYNDTNDDYFLQNKYVTDDELNLMLLSGNEPDIIALSGNGCSIVSEMAEDLSGYIPDDLKNDSYSSALLDLCKKDDKIYEIFPEYLFLTLYGENRNLEKTGLMSVKDFTANAGKTSCESLFYGISQTDLFYYLIFSDLYSYIDEEKSKISFDNELAEMLKIVKYSAVPDEYADSCDELIYQKYYGNSGDRFKKDLCMFEVSNMSLRLYESMIDYGDIDNPFLIGIPSSDGISVPVLPAYSVSILKSSENKNGAWSFMEYLISDDYQSKTDVYMPLKHSALKKQAKSCGIKNKIYNQIESMIENYAVMAFDNQILWDSVKDNLNEYFTDNISEEELLRKIANKVNLYYSETD